MAQFLFFRTGRSALDRRTVADCARYDTRSQRTSTPSPKGNEKTVTNVNTHVTGSGTVYVNSGNDTNLRGATVSGETVIADIGGDLNIESQLDTATANAKQVGASLGVGSNPAGLTGGLSGSYQTAKGDAAIVSEQSGIHAGEGGFDIKVDGNTKLKDGLITSEADPNDNRLETGTLEFEDLDTHSKWKADTYGGDITGSGPIVSPLIKEGESETGKVLTAISPGEIVITAPDNQKQNINDLRRDTTETNTSLPGIPDLQTLLDEQLKIQQLYDDAAAKAAGDRSSRWPGGLCLLFGKRSMVTEAVGCLATVACSAAAGIMWTGAATALAKQLETAAEQSGVKIVPHAGKRPSQFLIKPF